jgi:23S rRNA (cytidine2498-2'-O)-methyltransferase
VNSFLLFRAEDPWGQSCVSRILDTSVVPFARTDLLNSPESESVFDSKLQILKFDPRCVSANTSTIRLLEIWADDGAECGQFSSVRSIGEARNLLSQHEEPAQIWRAIPRGRIRRGALLEEQVRRKKWKLPLGWASAANLQIKQSWQKYACGGFIWLDSDQLLWATRFREIAPEGRWSFVEDRKNPPSRAYLKLWEWSWRSAFQPLAGERVLDLGASPGGWTWVLLEAGCRVVTLDRSSLDELDPRVRSRIESAHQGDAFDLTSWPIGPWDWVTCDVIASPQRSLQLIEALRQRDQRFVITVKFKGVPETEDLRLLSRQLDDRRVTARRLWHNKHEITVWMDRP